MKNASVLKLKHLMIVNILVLGSLTGTSAQADKNIYLSAGMAHNNTIKTVWLADKKYADDTDEKYNYKSAIHPQLTIGIPVADNWEVELYIGKQGGKFKPAPGSGNDTNLRLNYSHYLARARYHIDIGESKMLNPYIGFGYGTTDGKMSDVEVTFTTKTKSSQLFFGNRFDLSNDWFADMAYNYTKVGKTKYKTKSEDLKNQTYNISSHSVSSMSFSIGRRF